jgi:hypothetical protein
VRTLLVPGVRLSPAADNRRPRSPGFDAGILRLAVGEEPFGKRFAGAGAVSRLPPHGGEELSGQPKDLEKVSDLRQAFTTDSVEKKPETPVQLWFFAFDHPVPWLNDTKPSGCT